MPRRYLQKYEDTAQGQYPWADSAEEFSRGFSSGIEQAYLRKQLRQEKEEERKYEQAKEAAKIRAQLGMSGYKSEPVGVFDEQHPNPVKEDRTDTTVDYMGTTFRKKLNPYEQDLAEAKLAEARNKANDPSGLGAYAAKQKILENTGLGAQKFTYEKEKGAIKQKEIDKVNKNKSDAFVNSATSALKSINKIRSGIKYFGMNSLVPTIPGTEHANWRASFNKLVSGKILDVLGEMKAQSRTGASGFGQLNAGELKVITDASTELKENLSEERAAELLSEMEMAFNKILEREASSPFLQETQTDISEDDIQETMRLHPEYSREQILQMIGGGQ